MAGQKAEMRGLPMAAKMAPKDATTAVKSGLMDYSKAVQLGWWATKMAVMSDGMVLLLVAWKDS